MELKVISSDDQFKELPDLQRYKLTFIRLAMESLVAFLLLKK